MMFDSKKEKKIYSSLREYYLDLDLIKIKSFDRLLVIHAVGLLMAGVIEAGKHISDLLPILSHVIEKEIYPSRSASWIADPFLLLIGL